MHGGVHGGGSAGEKEAMETHMELKAAAATAAAAESRPAGKGGSDDSAASGSGGGGVGPGGTNGGTKGVGGGVGGLGRTSYDLAQYGANFVLQHPGASTEAKVEEVKDEELESSVDEKE